MERSVELQKFRQNILKNKKLKVEIVYSYLLIQN